MAERPMFPLESVLVPGMVLPLHVFEPRHRALVRDCLARDREFGVVLIERGSEVGGGDTRSSSGTVARIVQAEELSDGRWAVVAVGDRRVRVVEWLDDDPYPRAVLDDWADSVDADVDVSGRYEGVAAKLRRVLAMAAELGHPVSVDFDLGDDPVAGSHHLAVLAPLGPLDRQRLLTSAGPAERLALLDELLDEEAVTLEARLTGG